MFFFVDREFGSRAVFLVVDPRNEAGFPNQFRVTEGAHLESAPGRDGDILLRSTEHQPRPAVGVSSTVSLVYRAFLDESEVEIAGYYTVAFGTPIVARDWGAYCQLVGRPGAGP